MKSSLTPLARALAAIALGASLVASATPALSQPASGPRAGEQRRMDPEQMRERIQARIDRMATRLQITASQEEAWAAYAKVRLSMFNPPANRPDRDADAATITSFRAERAQQRAQGLARLAEATAALQQALAPEQRKVLDEITRRAGARRMHGGRHGPEMDGGGGMQRPGGEERRFDRPRSELTPESEVPVRS